MKITDYSILFMFIISSFIVVYNLKDNMLFQSTIHNEEINRVVDNVTVAALEKGYRGIEDTEEKINNDIVVECFFTDMCHILCGANSKLNREKIADNILCFMIIHEDGYYLWENEKVGEKILFQNVLHEKRIAEIEDAIEKNIKKYNYKILLPKNDGEYNSQTIKPNYYL